MLLPLPPLLQVRWFPNGEQLVTSSADKSVRCWDAEAGVQIKRLSEHTSIVNSISPLQRGPALFVSGGDDSKIKVGTAHTSLQPHSPCMFLELTWQQLYL